MCTTLPLREVTWTTAGRSTVRGVLPVPRAPLTPDGVRAALGDLAAHLGRVDVVPTTGSTSTDLVAAVGAAPDAWPDRSVLVTDHQVAGRGRAGRTWTTPQGTALTFSLLVRPGLAVDRLGWLPLLAGLGVARAVGELTGLHAGVKWPNDVVVDDPAADDVPGWGRRRKVAGVLAELVPVPGQAPAVVVGVGVNVGQDAAELPVPSAASLRSLGHDVDRAGLLAAVLARVVEVETRLRAAGGDAAAAGVAQEVAAACTTLGSAVRVELPGGDVVRGRAVGLAADGALRVRSGGEVRTVHAGDVQHLRADDGGGR